MNLPGFTAEESLTRSRENYQLDFVGEYTGTSSYRGTVRLAQSDMFVPHDPLRVTPDTSMYRPRPFFCLIPCASLPGTPRCPPYLGIRNPVTGHCERIF